MSAARIQKLNALLKRVEERRLRPRLLAVPSALAAPQAAPASRVAVAPQAALSSVASAPERDLFASTIPPAAPGVEARGSAREPNMADAAQTIPPAEGFAPSVRPEPMPAASAEGTRRPPSSSPLEDAMAQLGVAGEDSGPLPLDTLASPPQRPARPSLPDVEFRANQDLLLTHRPAAGSSAPPPGPLVELVQPKAHTPREPTIQFDTGVTANPLTQRDLRPVGIPLESPPELALSAPSHTIEPAPLLAHAAPVRVVSSARSESAKTFGELLEASLSLRPTPAPAAR